MTQGLERWYGGHDLHLITCSCYHRQPQLGSAYRCDLFLRLLKEARQQLQFVVYGYVVMPEPFHLLISEPEKGDPSLVMKVVSSVLRDWLTSRCVKALRHKLLLLFFCFFVGLCITSLSSKLALPC